MGQADSQDSTPTGVAAFLGVVFGSVFAGVGVAIIVVPILLLWFGILHPIFAIFGVVGGSIGIVFVATGGSVIWMSLRGLVSGTPLRPLRPGPAIPLRQGCTPPTPPPAVYYTCPHCGASLADGADVSPHGDVKCGYCASWFNIHQA